MPARTVVRRVRNEAPAEPDEDDRVKPTDDEETPRSGRRAARRVTSTTATSSSRRGRDDDDDDDEDKEAAKAEREARRGKSVRSGWSGYKQTKAEAGDFPENFSPDAEASLVAFLEDEPFADYRQHWIERPGKKSWTCGNDDCPICDVGDRPQVKVAFNVAVLVGEAWENKVWTVGSRVAGVLENYASDKKTGPLSTHDPMIYWDIRKTGKAGKSQTSVNPVKERDLGEDWGVDPLSEEDLAAMREGMWDASAVQVHTRKQLKEIADELADGDED